MSQIRGALLFVCLWFCFIGPASASKKPHYRFVLPYGYTGWVQIIFNDPAAQPLSVDTHTSAVIFDIPEQGLVRTQALFIHGQHADLDEFIYERTDNSGHKTFVPMSTDFYLPGVTHGGFTVMDTGGKGPGYSLFLFFGPPYLRKQTKDADWQKVIDEFQTHGTRRVEFDGNYPLPGSLRKKD